MIRLLADRRGAVSLIAAGVLVAGIGGLSFAADLGSVYLAGRRLQGIADAAALSAAANIAAPLEAARATVADNGWSARASTAVTTGTWSPEATEASRFVAAAASPDAVRVALQTDAPLVFGRLFGRSSMRITRRATAARRNMASFSIGSRIAGLDAGVANALLSALLGNGSRVSLSLADYQALASADIDVLSFAGALRRQVRVATFDQALATSVTPAQALRLAADTLGGTGPAASGLRTLAASASALPATPLSPLLSLGPLGRQDHAATAAGSAGVNALGFARALIELAGGSRQVSFDLATGLKGLAGASVRYATGARPSGSSWMTLTGRGDTIVSTAQSRLLIDAYAGDVATTQGLAQVHLPLFVELAEARAKLHSLSCPRGARRLQLQVQPALGHVSIAGFSDLGSFGNHATPLAEGDAAFVTAVRLVSITGSARTNLSNGAWQTATFVEQDIAGGATQVVSSQGFTGGVAVSLASRLNLGVQVGPLKLPDLGLGKLVGDTLSKAAPSVDTLLGSLTGLLGLGVGQADVRVNGVRCGVPALVA